MTMLVCDGETAIMYVFHFVFLCYLFFRGARQDVCLEGGRGGEGKAREEVVAVVTVMEANYRLARAIYYR